MLSRGGIGRMGCSDKACWPGIHEGSSKLESKDDGEAGGEAALHRMHLRRHLEGVVGFAPHGG
jgi:hypothetical protein